MGSGLWKTIFQKLSTGLEEIPAPDDLSDHFDQSYQTEFSRAGWSLFITSHWAITSQEDWEKRQLSAKNCQDIPQSIEESIGREKRQTPNLATLQLCIKRSQFSGTSGQTWEEASSVGSFRHNLWLGQDHGAADHTGRSGEQENYTAEQVFNQGMSIFTRLWPIIPNRVKS